MHRNLPAPPLEPLVPTAPPYPNWPVASEPQIEDAGPPLSHRLWVLRRHRWKILAFVAACELATLIVSSRVTPIYESTAVVDIDRQAPVGVIGEDATRASANDADQFLATQIKLIQADGVLRPVAKKYNLLERERQFQDWPRLTSLQIEGAPILLRRLKIARPPNTYLLLISYRSPDAYLAADVANAIANSYLQHIYDIRVRSSASLASYMEREMEELKSKMESSTQRLIAFERELNVISPEEKTAPGQITAQELRNTYRIEQVDVATRVYGVAGDPVAHSLSPAIMNAALRRENVNGVYLALHAKTLKDLLERKASS